MPNEIAKIGDELVELVIAEPEQAVDASEDESSESKEVEASEITKGEDEASTASKLTPREISAKQQEEAWFANVLNGKKQLSEAPEWLQKRLQVKFDNLNKEPEIEKVIEKKLEEKLSEQRFQEMLKSTPTLTPSQAEILKLKYGSLREKLGKEEAYDIALKYAGVDLKRDERKLARAKMTLPPSGMPRERKSEDPKDIAKDSKRWKQWIKEQDAQG